MAARALRAVCILSLTGLIGIAWAVDNKPAENASIKSSTSTPAINKTTPAARLPVKPQIKSAKPLWTDLTPPQQQALAPLSSDWDKIDAFRKQKWLVIANKFPSMKPEEQQRLQDRMREWAKLTPAQRRAARESYERAKKLNANQKSEKWQQYQNLPEEEKKKLAAEAEAKNKKHLANLPRSGTNKNRVPTSIKSVTKPSLVKPVVPQPVVPAQTAPTQSVPLQSAPSQPPQTVTQTPTK
ncbi:MAG TPA: DUF3106 domain-containing protein [Burkholderiaceae bacterium]|jgi:hypothetical protein